MSFGEPPKKKAFLQKQMPRKDLWRDQLPPPPPRQRTARSFQGHVAGRVTVAPAWQCQQAVRPLLSGLSAAKQMAVCSQDDPAAGTFVCAATRVTAHSLTLPALRAATVPPPPGRPPHTPTLARGSSPLFGVRALRAEQMQVRLRGRLDISAATPRLHHTLPSHPYT